MLVNKAQQRINGLAGFVVLSLLGAVVSAVITPAPQVAQRNQGGEIRALRINGKKATQVVFVRCLSCPETRSN